MSGHPALRLRGFHVNRLACLPALGCTVVAVAQFFEKLRFMCRVCDVLGIVSTANAIVAALSCRPHADAPPASHLRRCQMQPPMSTSDRVHRCFHSLPCTQIVILLSDRCSACGAQPNFRGSTGFGEACVQALPGRAGTDDVADCMTALAAAIEKGLPAKPLGYKYVMLVLLCSVRRSGTDDVADCMTTLAAAIEKGAPLDISDCEHLLRLRSAVR